MSKQEKRTAEDYATELAALRRPEMPMPIPPLRSPAWERYERELRAYLDRKSYLEVKAAIPAPLKSDKSYTFSENAPSGPREDF